MYKLAFYNADIAPGATIENAGLNIQGNGAPSIKLIEAKYYSNGIGGTNLSAFSKKFQPS